MSKNKTKSSHSKLALNFVSSIIGREKCKDLTIQSLCTSDTLFLVILMDLLAPTAQNCIKEIDRTQPQQRSNLKEFVLTLTGVFDFPTEKIVSIKRKVNKTKDFQKWMANVLCYLGKQRQRQKQKIKHLRKESKINSETKHQQPSKKRMKKKNEKGSEEFEEESSKNEHKKREKGKKI